MNDLSIVIVSYNTSEKTLKCLKSIFSKKWKVKFSVLLIDNGSTDDTLSQVKKKFSDVQIIENTQNLGFAKANNIGLKRSTARYYLLLNSDCEVFEKSLDNLFEFAKETNFAISTCKLVYYDGTFQHNGGHLPLPLPMFFWLSGIDDIFNKLNINLLSYHMSRERQYYNGRELGWIGGAVMLIRKDVFENVGYLDEKIFMYGEDVDFCWRARVAGYKIGWTDEAMIMHVGGGSSEYPRYVQWKGEMKGLLYLYRKYHGIMGEISLRILMYIFILLRAFAFLLIGKFNYAKTYAKIITSI